MYQTPSYILLTITPSYILLTVLNPLLAIVVFAALVVVCAYFAYVRQGKAQTLLENAQKASIQAPGVELNTINPVLKGEQIAEMPLEPSEYLSDKEVESEVVNPVFAQ
jgi:hypothetical protein